jgi:DNA-directed RNA polymerase beta' subunit
MSHEHKHWFVTFRWRWREAMMDDEATVIRIHHHEDWQISNGVIRMHPCEYIANNQLKLVSWATNKTLLVGDKLAEVQITWATPITRTMAEEYEYASMGTTKAEYLKEQEEKYGTEVNQADYWRPR